MYVSGENYYIFFSTSEWKLETKKIEFVYNKIKIIIIIDFKIKSTKFFQKHHVDI